MTVGFAEGAKFNLEGDIVGIRLDEIVGTLVGVTVNVGPEVEENGESVWNVGFNVIVVGFTVMGETGIVGEKEDSVGVGAELEIEGGRLGETDST